MKNIKFVKRDSTKLSDSTDLVNTLTLQNKQYNDLIAIKDNKIKELETIIECYSNELSSIPDVQNVTNQLIGMIKVCDDVRMDNLKLKNELACECQKYMDLKQSFVKLHEGIEYMKLDVKEKDKARLVEEKMSLESTLVSLTEEVEALSQK